MFAVDRYDPTAGKSHDKQSRLNSFNDRLKRKRTKIVAEPEVKPDNDAGEITTPDKSLSPERQDGQDIDAAPAARKPHREKKVKRKAVVPEPVEEDLGPSKVSHVLKKFHKIQERQERASKTDTQDDADGTEVAEEAETKVLDLGPVPQATSAKVKRPVISRDAGLPEYLRKPNVFASTDSMPFASMPLCKKIQDNLKKCEFENAFAVQATLLPVLLADHLPELRRDFLVSAPTGSGKTLAYVLPILQTLQSRIVPRLRAIIIVPTRELVEQVQSTFESLSSKLGLQIEILSTSRSLAAEQPLLVNDYEPTAPMNMDILICTPGRLVEHIKSTPRFTLQDLRFLVIDEGDKLLNQSFQGWSALVDEALKPLAVEEDTKFDIFKTRSQERCQKLIFSATISSDPSLLAQLNLVDPALYLEQHTADQGDGNDQVSITKFTTPKSLDEFFVHVPESVPTPFALLTTIHRLSVTKALVFTNTTESALKLATLMSRLGIGRCEAITSTITPAVRRRHFTDFNNSTGSDTNAHEFTGDKESNTIRFLVTTDLMARGIDLDVECVLNYDSSVSISQYIHRVGRTARAGKYGRAVSLVENTVGKYWWNQIGKKINRVKPVQRVTMFPKPTRRIDKHNVEGDENGEHNIQADGDREHNVEGDEMREDNVEGDEDTEMQDVSELDDEQADEQAEEQVPQNSKNKKRARRTPAPQQVELKDVDMDALRNTFDSALADLQRGS